jgi:murein DD-endopeptidase MepM/ murein hydrolase activator NlpD
MLTGKRQARGASPVRAPRDYPRHHHYALALTVLAAVAITSNLLSAGSRPPPPAAAVEPEQLPLAVDVIEAAPAVLEEPAQVTEPVVAESTTPMDPWRNFEVRSGDSLSLLFHRAGLNDGDVYSVVSAEGGKSLTRIYPGQTLGFLFDDAGELAALRHIRSRLESTLFTRTETGYEVERLAREPVRQRTFVSATIRSSLFMAGQDAGLSQTTIMELANIFGGVIDFVLDPRAGDTFHVLYEELYLDGEKYRDGVILAAEFVNRGKAHSAYRYETAAGKPGYFSEQGESMRKAFMLAPVDFTRISSNFNLRRLHPIYKTTRPHRGTDYAAPRGTPVYAAGEGRVTESGYTRANGNYVVIQHGEAYTTKYLHLHKRKVRQGDRVGQQQVIGTVGSTGAATGPHLHYEFLVNGVHRNPRTIHKKLPKPERLPDTELARFEQAISPFRTRLAEIREQHLAARGGPESTTASL